MGRPRNADIDVATTERILAAAEAELAAHGLAAARLEDIAAAAGVRRPSLLYHFGTKEALYAAAVARSFDRLRAALTAAISGEGGFDTRLDRLVEGYVTFLAENPSIAKLVARELMSPSDAGRALFEGELARTLDLAEGFLRSAGRGRIRRGVNVRAAILQVAGGAIFYAIAGPFRAKLWREPRGARPGAHAATVRALTRHLVLAPATARRKGASR